MILRDKRRQALQVFSGKLIRVGVTVLPVLTGFVMSVSQAAPTPVVVVTKMKSP